MKNFNFPFGRFLLLGYFISLKLVSSVKMAKSGLEYFDSNEEKYQCLICGRCFLIVCDEKVLTEHLDKNHRKKLNDLNVLKAKESYCID